MLQKTVCRSAGGFHTDWFRLETNGRVKYRETNGIKFKSIKAGNYEFIAYHQSAQISLKPG